MFSKQMNVVMDEEFLNQAVKEAKLSPRVQKDIRNKQRP